MAWQPIRLATNQSVIRPFRACTQITWDNVDCANPADCNHTNTWEHTPNDAFMAQACQGNAPNKTKTDPVMVAMRRFQADQDAWVSVRPLLSCPLQASESRQ
jgi:hypothetical protein